MQTEIYAFNDRGDVNSVKNSNGRIMKYYNKLKQGSKLTREEKNILFHILQGNSGKHNYMLMGCVIPFKQFLKRYFVKYNYGSIEEIWSFDKTCIRNSFYTNSCISEIIEITK